MEQELTMEELIALINSQKGDFVIRVELERRRCLMPKKNDFKLDVVSVRLVKDAPIYSEHTFNNPADIAAVMGDCMCQFDREVVCVVNLRSDLNLSMCICKCWLFK